MRSAIAAVLLSAGIAVAQSTAVPGSTTQPGGVLAPPVPTSKRAGARSYLDQPAGWYAGEEAKKITNTVLSNQAANGTWPKNFDTTAIPSKEPAEKIHGTFDNGATTDEMRLLAKVYNATHDERCHVAVVKALDLILKAQYANGGWPQSYPPGKGYDRYITFNDGAMARLMELLRDAYASPTFAFIDDAHKEAAREAFNRGIDCILKCQVKVDGRLTVWCAQHDDKTFEPRMARKFELVSLSGSESVGLIRLLMGIENPTPQEIAAVDAAVAWFDAVKIPGIRTQDIVAPDQPRGRDRIVVKDPSAPPMWARFYEIGTNRPMFSDRDSVVKYSLAEIGHERRNGYRWLSYWGKELLATEYPEWKAKHPTPAAVPAANG